MRTTVQVLYGPYNMSNQKCHVDSMNERSLPSQEIQKMVISRKDGSTKVADRYADKAIKLTGYLKVPTGSSNTFREIEDEFDNSVSKKSRTFRVARRWLKMWDVDSDSGWTGGGDTVNITTDSYNYMVSNASLNFDFDVSYSGNDYAEVYNTSLTAVDLSSVEETGNIEFWIFLEDSEEVEDIDVRWGSDDSNYWYETGISNNYEANALETGWNYISIYWPTASSTGTPDSSAIDYFYLKVNYSTNQDDSQNNKLSGIRWIDEEEVTNYEADSITIDKQEDPWHIDYQRFTGTLTALKGIAVSTHTITAVSRSTLSSASKGIQERFYGSYRPKPQILYTFSSIGTFNQLTYSNETTDESMTINTTFTVGDSLFIDTETLQCLLNASDVSYTGVFPRHIVGLNNVSTLIEDTSSTETVSFTDDNTISGNYGGIGLTRYYAQSFQTTSDGNLTSVKFKCRADLISGSYTRDPNTTVQLGEGASPNVATANSIGTLTVPYQGTATWEDFYISSDPENLALTSGTTYWLIWEPFDVVGLLGGSEFYLKFRYNSSGGYANGKAMYYDGSSWNNGVPNGSDPDDFAFEITVEPDQSSDLNYDWNIYYKKRYV